MKFTVGLKPFYGNIFKHNQVFKINDGHNIFFGFNKVFAQDGIEIITLDALEKNNSVDRYVYCDIPYPWEYAAWSKVLRNRNKNILFCFDSPIVTPFSHISLLHNFFSKIYTWDDTRIDNIKYFKLYIPQLSTEINTKPIPSEEKKFLTLINSNRFSPFLFKLISKYKMDLYKERLKAINFFEDKAPTLLDLYGKGWNKSGRKYKIYKGQISEGKKIETLSKYKFSICFENAEAPGYITEKIFDCFKARCVPIYWGATNITDHVSKDCFIDFREFMNYEKLLKYLKNVSEKTYNRYIESIEEFLETPTTRSKWFEDGFRKTFLEAIGNYE